MLFDQRNKYLIRGGWGRISWIFHQTVFRTTQKNINGNLFKEGPSIRIVGQFLVCYYMGRVKQKTCFRVCAKCVDSHYPAHAQGLILAFTLHSLVSTYSVRGQRRPWSDCVDVQAFQRLRCPPEDTSLPRMARIQYLCIRPDRSEQTVVYTCSGLSVGIFRVIGHRW